MYKLTAAEAYKDDLDKALSYIKDQLRAPIAASNLADNVAKCYRNLKENPYIYEQCRAPRLARKGYRRAVINNFVLIYRIEEERKLVCINRFFYGSSDYERLL